ncbi:hypothetical protein ACOMHN_011241 [Nucella lapillus]
MLYGTMYGAVFLLLYQLVHFQGVASENESKGNLTDEHRLWEKLRKDHNYFTRPVFNASKPVQLKLGVSLTQIFDLDEKNQALITDVWLDHEWFDEKLTWDPKDYNGLAVFRFPSDYLWKPDIVLYNRSVSAVGH